MNEDDPKCTARKLQRKRARQDSQFLHVLPQRGGPLETLLIVKPCPASVFQPEEHMGDCGKSWKFWGKAVLIDDGSIAELIFEQLQQLQVQPANRICHRRSANLMAELNELRSRKLSKDVEGCRRNHNLSSHRTSFADCSLLSVPSLKATEPHQYIENLYLD